jgi:hypothetical protein
VGDGLPEQVDSRVKALGNAVVPQIPELIGYAILDSLRGSPPRAGHNLSRVPQPFNDTRGGITECDALTAPVVFPFHDNPNSPEVQHDGA